MVIDIPEEYYKRALLYKDLLEDGNLTTQAVISVANGTPLPKGHGDLIDRDKLDCDSDWSDWTDDFMAVSWSQINDAEAIIEADEVES